MTVKVTKSQVNLREKLAEVDSPILDRLSKAGDGLSLQGDLTTSGKLKTFDNGGVGGSNYSQLVVEQTSESGNASLSLTSKFTNVNNTDNEVAAIKLGTITNGDSTPDADISFETINNGSLGERMRIDSSGNVIIGGTSAFNSATFQVETDTDTSADGAGVVHIYNHSTTSGASASILFQSDEGGGDNRRAYIEGLKTGAGNGGGLAFSTRQVGGTFNDQVLLIDDLGDATFAGTIQIDNTSDEAIDLNGTAANPYIRWHSSSGGNQWIIQNVGGTSFRIQNATNARNDLSFDGLGHATFARNIVMTSGYGIDFSANANASGMTSELLDDYEEGTFTPTLEDPDSGNAVSSYYYRTGTYTKIGKVVHISITISPNNMGTLTNSTDDVMITGLPFAAHQTISNYNQALAIQSFNNGTRDYTVASLRATESKLRLYNINGGSWATVKGNNVVGGGQQIVTGTYLTDA